MALNVAFSWKMWLAPPTVCLSKSLGWKHQPFQILVLAEIWLREEVQRISESELSEPFVVGFVEVAARAAKALVRVLVKGLAAASSTAEGGFCLSVML